jgi:hypothetical protein
MPVSIHVPIRIRTDPHSLAEDGDGVEATLARALARALAETRRQVLEPRGTAVGVQFDAPTFRWTGTASSDVTPELRDATESRIAELLWRTAEASGVFELARKNAEARLPLEDEPRAQVERGRILPGGYMIPSYDTAGSVDFEPEEIVVARDPKKTKASMLLPVGQWKVFDDARNTIEPLLAAAREADLEDADGVCPSPLGALYLTPAGYPQLAVWVGDESHEPVLAEFYTLGGLTRTVWEGADLVEAPAKLPPGGLYQLEPFKPATDVSTRRAVLKELIGARLTEQSVAISRPDQIDPNTFQNAIKEHVDASLTKMAEEAHSTAVGYLVLRTPSGERYAVAIPQSYPFAEPVTVLPLVDVVLRPAGSANGESGTGKAKGKGKGKGTKPGLKRGEKGSGDADSESEPGGFVIAPESSGDARGSKFPPIRVGGGAALSLGPLEGEASLEELGEEGKRIREIMARIAYRLDMPMGEYPGAFAVAAAMMASTRSVQVGQFAVEQMSATKNVEGGKGNLGKIQFSPLPSPAIQLLRHLAGTTWHIYDLREAISDLYMRSRAHANLIRGVYKGNGAGWSMRMYEALAPKMKDAIGLGIFRRGCQTLMLQLLRTSRDAILQRTNNPEYAALFKYLVMTQLTAVEKLLAMRDQILAIKSMVSPSVQGSVHKALGTWRDVRRAMGVDAGGQTRIEGKSASTPTGSLRYVDGEWLVRDEHDHDWSMNDLDEAISIRRGTAEGIDPLIKQIVDIPDVLPKLRADPKRVGEYLEKLLADMLENNREQTTKVKDSTDYAFRASKIREDLPKADIRGTNYQLQGIHLVFHETIGDAFGGNPYYGMGIDSLFSSELGKESLANFFEFAGTLLLSIACPPLGMAVGAAFASHRRDLALDRMQLYHSLIDPELVASYTEIELDLFMAELELVMNLIPMGGKAAKAAFTGLRAIAKQGVRRGLQAAGRQILKEMLEEVADQLKKGLLKLLLTEIVQQQVMEVVLQQLLEPVIQELYKEMGVGGPIGAAPSVGLGFGASPKAAPADDVVTMHDVRQLPISEKDPPEEES